MRQIGLAATAAVLAVAFPNGAAGQWAPVEKTGQTACHDPSGTLVSCAGTGHDGESQVGVPWPTPRFSNSGDGTVTDNLTGLVWLEDASCADLPGTLAEGKATWGGARAAADALANGTCGLSDGSSAGQWRLPTVKELLSLVHHGYASPAVPNTAGTGQWSPGDPFIGVENFKYWSSTFYTNGSDAWQVETDQGRALWWSLVGEVFVWPVRGGRDSIFTDGFESGDTNRWSSASPTPALAVRTPAAPVERTGQTVCYDGLGGTVSCEGTGQDGELQAGMSWPSPRFIDNGDGTVTDALTGLVWLQDAMCFIITMAWQEALYRSGALFDGCTTCGGASGDCGLTDGSGPGEWRLPNLKEMASLLDYEFTDPCLSDAAGSGQWSDGDPFSDLFTHSWGYWTSTSVTDDEVGAYKVNLMACNFVWANKVTSQGQFWPVKGPN